MGNSLWCSGCPMMPDDEVQQESKDFVETQSIRPFLISPESSPPVGADSRLYRDQKLNQTGTGLEICTVRIPINQLKNYIQTQLSTDMVMKCFVDHVNTETNKITQNFYITSFGGMKLKSIKALQINLIMNATIDLPMVDFPQELKIETLRVPITSNDAKTLKLYMDDVADKVHENYLKNGNTLIYCHDGNFNSVVLALGYLLKYTDLCLSEALLHMQYSRKGFSYSHNMLGPYKKIVYEFAEKCAKTDKRSGTTSSKKKRHE